MEQTPADRVFGAFPFLLLLRREAAMSLPLAAVRRAISCRFLTVVFTAIALFTAPGIGRADEPTGDAAAAGAEEKPQPPGVARPAEALAGDLAHVRPEKFRRNKTDVLSTIDTAKDVLYTSGENPIPETQQFRFVERFLQTPDTGDARLVLPVEVPKFYQLAVQVQSRQTAHPDPGVVLGLVLDGHPFLIEVQREGFTFGQYFDRPVSSRYLHSSTESTGAKPMSTVINVLVGDCGFLCSYSDLNIEWIGRGDQLSLDPQWAMPAADKIFLSFPDAQFQIVSVRLKPLSREAWLEQINQIKPGGRLAWFGRNAGETRVASDVETLPEFENLELSFVLRAYEGDFDELERWAARFRKSDLTTRNGFASELFYAYLSRAFLNPLNEPVVDDVYFEQQLDFADGWLKAKPESVAARIVKAKTYIRWVEKARGEGTLDTSTPDGSQLFQERMKQAETVLQEAVRRQGGDSCVFSTLLAVGSARGWDDAHMERTFDRGLSTSKKNFDLVENMVTYLLPHWHGQPGGVAKFAERELTQVKGDDGQDLYGRIALSMHYRGEDIADFSLDDVRAAIPVLVKRYPDHPRIANWCCFMACSLGDRDLAKPIFSLVGRRPDFTLWGSRQEFDQLHCWADPSALEPSRVLPSEGEEAANIQAFSDETVFLGFLPDNRTLVTASAQYGSLFKLWDCESKTLVKEFPVAGGYMDLFGFEVLTDGRLLTRVVDQRGVYNLALAGPQYQSEGAWVSEQNQPILWMSDNGHVKATFAKGKLSVYADSQLQHSFEAEYPVYSRLSRNGRYVFTIDKKVHIWDVRSGEELATLGGKPTWFIKFTENSEGLFLANDERFYIWDIVGNRELISIPSREAGAFTAGGTSRDGRYLATGERRGDAEKSPQYFVTLWDLKELTPIHTFEGHHAKIVRAAFANDNHWLATASENGAVKLWDLSQILQTETPGTGGVKPKPSRPGAPK